MASQRDGGVSWTNPPGYTGESWNVVRGCANRCGARCWAERQAIRQAKPGEAYACLVETTPNGPRWTGLQRFVAEKLAEPLHWREPRCVAVSLMGDLFGSGITDQQIARIYAVMLATRHHRYCVLTKQAERRRELLSSGGFVPLLEQECLQLSTWSDLAINMTFPADNVIELVSCSDQPTLDALLPDLLATPAAWRGVSLEPLLGPAKFANLRPTRTIHVCVDVAGALRNKSFYGLSGDDGRILGRWEAQRELERLAAEGVKVIPAHGCDDFDPIQGCLGHENPGLDWIIVGAESGTGPLRTKGARYCNQDWVLDVVRQCRDAGVACHVKQIHLGSPVSGFELSHDVSLWRDELRVRQWPEVFK